MRRLSALLVAAGLLAATAITYDAIAAGPADNPVASYIVQPGDAAGSSVARWRNVARNLGSGDVNGDASYLAAANGGSTSEQLLAGRVLWFDPTEINPTTTTTTVPSTTTTTVPSTTSTTTPSTTTTSTTAPSTSTTVVPTTTVPSGSGDFVETFTGNTGFDRFVHGVHHRDDFLVKDTQWPGDHDLNCGTPATQRTVHRNAPEESFWLCADHLMTGMGDTSGYSIVWFEPNQVFSAADTTTVSWDVNVTDLLARKWWEVMIVPTSFNSGDPGCPHCAVDPFLSPSPSNLPAYPLGAIVVGSGPFGNDGNIVSGGQGRDPLAWQHICGSFAVDPEGCASKTIRRQFSVTDNKDGTVSILFLGQTYTYPGGFPAEFRVVFKDHNYTPTKDGNPQGFTWHWDSISVT